jgi:hypothetical protein
MNFYAKSIRIGYPVTAAAVSLSMAGCFFFTDAGTRMAHELRDGAALLRASSQERVEITHTPLSFPEGVHGPYQVVLQRSVGCTQCGTLFVGDPSASNAEYTPSGGSTTYHLNYVTVPNELKVRKQKGESVVILLRKTADAIEVESLR